ncbi:IQ and ubiquitin-like domain-containing protein [Neodiprion virginianus]|uniref:IQ and ubiquitin-like domain-containing protein n=1 Tax=Neodiprion virginianus TaxID=2961670 RepID=UPI001EE74E86|nr:IQ and ubiquitin-like domain-containing protein [Neodiprion virginianus]
MVIVVEIVDNSTKKPFLGGWKDVRTQREYHNATTQTRPRDPKVSWDSLTSRDTQTTVFVDKSTEVPLEKGSQTFENGIHIPRISDKYLLAGKFEPKQRKDVLQDGGASSENLEAFAVKIQKCYRAYRTRAMIRHFASIFRNLVRTNVSFYRTFEEQHGNRRQLHIINSTKPRTRDDFEMLYNLVDRWRIEEIERANRTFMKCSKMAAHAVILQKEIELLRAIDRMKTEVKQAQVERRNMEFLIRRTKPITWTGYRGCTVSMETLRVQKAKEYKRLYESMSRMGLTVKERLNLLLEIKEFLKAHTCEIVLEIIYLIDQELCLLSRNVHETMLEQLRARLKLAFLYFIRKETSCDAKCRTEEEAVALNQGPGGRRVITNQMTRVCGRCGKLLPITRFGLNRHQRISTCLNCENIAPKSSVRPVHEPFDEMLRRVRKHEAKMKAFDSVAFVIGPKGIRHLVTVIWHGKSGISECTDLHQLALVRFQKEATWAPWNTLVLTKREANVHEEIEEPNRVYSKHLIEKFLRKNLQARVTFKSLDMFAVTSMNDSKARIINVDL